MKKMTLRAACFLACSAFTMALASACASESEAFPQGSSSTDASADGSGAGQCAYCPPQGTAKGCCLPNGTCGIDNGMGCVSKTTTYGGP